MARAKRCDFDSNCQLNCVRRGMRPSNSVMRAAVDLNGFAEPRPSLAHAIGDILGGAEPAHRRAIGQHLAPGRIVEAPLGQRRIRIARCTELMRIFSFAYCNAADLVKVVMAPLAANQVARRDCRQSP